MILLKNRTNLEGMRKAGQISVGALLAAKSAIRDGATTNDVDRAVRTYIENQGATPSFLGYMGFPASCCVSINEEVIHGIPGDRVLREGDLVSVDVGAEWGGYHGDNAATFPVGRISQEDQKLLDVTRECLMRAVFEAKQGNRIGDISHAVQAYAEQNGFSVLREFVGHGVGRKLHEEPEVPNFGTAGRGLRLLKGMTLAIEPMVFAGGPEIAIGENGWTVSSKDRSSAAHFEMSIAVLDNVPEILTDWSAAF